MRLLLVGNHTCGNRGDAAILRGLIEAIEEHDSSISIDIISRFPISSSYLLGRQVDSDSLYDYHTNKKIRKRKKIKGKTLSKRLLWYTKGFFPLSLLPLHIKKHIEFIKKYDAVIQVGGSFFVDLYGSSQFEHPFCSIIAKKPIYLLGHSVGPFKKKLFNKISKFIFANITQVSLREKVSHQLMKDAKLPLNKTHDGADTAWLVNPKKFKIPSHLSEWIKQKPTIAITLRHLAPFDKRLGISQTQYEQRFAYIINRLTSLNYQVIALSTCTGIDGYKNDDRMIALKLKTLVNNQSSYLVAMDELNDVELGNVLNLCKFTIGTRLHSAIISMNFGTPAIAINYEHKSEGIMQQLEMPELSHSFKSFMSSNFETNLLNLLDQSNTMKEKIKIKVDCERNRANKMVQLTLTDINSHI